MTATAWRARARPIGVLLVIRIDSMPGGPLAQTFRRSNGRQRRCV
jgi:hypothetical protein